MQHDGPRTHLCTIFDDACLEMCEVPDECIVAHGRRPFQRGVDHRSVLNAGAGTDANLPVVAAEYRRRPDAGLGSDEDRTDDDRVRVHESTGIDGGLLGAERVDGHEIVLLAWVAHDAADGYRSHQHAPRRLVHVASGWRTSTEGLRSGRPVAQRRKDRRCAARRHRNGHGRSGHSRSGADQAT